ncbi:hypothetical protein SEUCBS140593_007854 [Sporothrix eucalyptigena]|uniref:non-specific serine/threonine protein kinase n=1 Tax=Sporothrix eucalyptigena TaxID=1812306 RepID=A0ABP0CI05_9PEZI
MFARQFSRCSPFTASGRRFPSPSISGFQCVRASSSSSLPKKPDTTLDTEKGSRPQRFPTSGFELFDAGQLIEEENLPRYERTEYYPMHIGDIVGGHYQVVGKLGYGTTSTVWLARDLWSKEKLYRVLKVHIHTAPYGHELSIFYHLKKPIQQEIDDKEEHPGRDHVRKLEDFFLVDGPHGEHAVFVMEPMGMSLGTMQARSPKQLFEPMLVKSAIDQVLLGLALLHGADVAHTGRQLIPYILTNKCSSDVDLHANNLLIDILDTAILSRVEDAEMIAPSARKKINDTVTVYTSHYILGGAGPLTISDFGQARIGKEHTGFAMPTQYRAPEVILDMSWGTPVNMWSAGVLVGALFSLDAVPANLQTWSLLEPESLFRIYDADSPELNNAHHLAAMTSLLGPPPDKFRERGLACRKYWDEQGQWKGPVPLPPSKPLADRITVFEGEEKGVFVDFLECFLAWLPEDRLLAAQTYFHMWLRGMDYNINEEQG